MPEEQEISSSKTGKRHGNIKHKSRSQARADQQILRGKDNPFRKSIKTAKEDFFDIEFDDSQADTVNSGTLSQNSDLHSVSDIFRHSKKSKGYKNNVKNNFDVDFEESQEVSSQDVENTPKSSSQRSNKSYSQDTALNFKKSKLFECQKLDSQASSVSSQKSETEPKALIWGKGKYSQSQDEKKHVDNAFEVGFEESLEVSSQNGQCTLNSSQNSNDTNNQDSNIKFERPILFNKKKLSSNYPCDIDANESDLFLTQKTQSSQISSISSPESNDVMFQEETRKRSLFQSQKEHADNALDIDFEESKDLMSQNIQNSPQSSQKETGVYSQDSTINFKRPKLFNNKKQSSNHSFGINVDESGLTSTQSSQLSQASTISSQKTNDALSQDKGRNNQLFQGRKKRPGEAFDLDFDESSCHETMGLSQNAQPSQSSQSKKENIEDTPLSFQKPGPFKKAKEGRLNKPFDIDFEESRNLLGTPHATPTLSKVIPFRKSTPKENDFDVNFHETNVDELTEKSVNRQVMNESSPSRVPDLSHTGMSRMNTTEGSAGFNQSSFNDENMQGWISDQPEDEIDINENLELERTHRQTLTPGDISAPLNITREEDRLQRLQLKLKEIIDNARNAVVSKKSLVAPQEKKPEKPKRPEKKSNTENKTRLRKPASFATKRLYNYITGKIKPKYGIDSVIKAEELVIFICDVVKIVMRRKNHQKKLINDLKLEMAKMGVIETTYQFYEFVREFLPYEFRLKVVPCIQPRTNIVYPPKDAINPFQKIL